MFSWISLVLSSFNFKCFSFQQALLRTLVYASACVRVCVCVKGVAYGYVTLTLDSIGELYNVSSPLCCASRTNYIFANFCLYFLFLLFF